MEKKILYCVVLEDEQISFVIEEELIHFINSLDKEELKKIAVKTIRRGTNNIIDMFEVKKEMTDKTENIIISILNTFKVEINTRFTELNTDINTRFNKIETDLIGFKTEMTEFKTEVISRLDKIEDRLDKVEDRLDRNNIF